MHKPVEVSDPIPAKNSIIPYCATCNHSWEPDPLMRLGTKFICPSDKGGSSHFAAIVKGEPGKFWLRIHRRILQYELHSLGHFHYGKQPHHKAIWMNVVRASIVIAALVGAGFGPVARIVSCILGLSVVLDILINATSVAFISRFPTDILRSIFMHFVSLVYVVSSYAACYAASRGVGSPLEKSAMAGSLKALYFSFITLTTIGYGDLVPLTPIAQVLVVSELLVGLYLISILLAIYVNWLGAPPSIKAPAKYSELFPVPALPSPGNAQTTPGS